MAHNDRYSAIHHSKDSSYNSSQSSSSQSSESDISQKPQQFTPTKEQKIIIEAPLRDNQLVIAGAGSGKTFTMTQRIVHLIRNNPQEVDPARILGLTFTTKAAHELSARVIQAIRSLSEDNNFSLQNKLFHLVRQPYIATYDAFFQSIVRQYGLLIGIDPDTTPLSDGGSFEIISATLKENMDSITQVVRHDDSLLEGCDNLRYPSFDDLGYAVRQLNSECLMYLIDEHTLTVEQALNKVKKWNDHLCEHLASLLKEAYEKDRGQYLLATKEGITKSKKRQDFYEIQQLYKIKQLYMAAKSRNLVIYCTSLYVEAKKTHHLAEFGDFTAAAFLLVERFPSIAQEFRRRYGFIFLDEFQDTSTTQAALLAKIFHVSSDEMSKEKYEEKYNETHSGSSKEAFYENDSSQVCSVTAVGDPFQGIYGWRGASSDAFSFFAEYFNVSTPHTLSQTVRNKEIVLDIANQLTDHLRAKNWELRGIPLSTRVGGSVDVKKLTPFSLSDISSEKENEVSANKAGIDRDKDTEKSHDQGISSGTDKGDSTDSTEKKDLGTIAALSFDNGVQEIEGIAAFIKNSLTRLDKNQFIDRKEPLAALLFRSKQHMDIYANGLEKLGLKCQVEGNNTFMSRPEVQDMLAVLKSIAQPSQVAPLMRLLASPRFNLSPTDLELLSRRAKYLQNQYIYQALIDSGIASGEENKTQKKQLIRQYQDTFPVEITIVNLLMREDVAEILSESLLEIPPLSARGIELCKQCSDILINVESASVNGIYAALHSAWNNLDLSTQIHTAHILKDIVPSISQTQKEITLVDFQQLASSYVSELPEGVHATIGGFVHWLEQSDNVVSSLSLIKLEKNKTRKDRSRNNTNSDSAHNADKVEYNKEDSQVPDVVLMTVHAAKGLEWPIVVIPDMEKGVFPSVQSMSANFDEIQLIYGSKNESDNNSQKNNSSEDYDNDEEPNKPEKVILESCAQSENAIWLLDYASVPVPLRLDRKSLPEFPHNAHFLYQGIGLEESGEENFPFSEVFPTIKHVYNEVFAPDKPVSSSSRSKKSHKTSDISSDVSIEEEEKEISRIPAFLSQQEEYGIKNFVEEMRLAYVALTRSKGDVLLSCHRYGDYLFSKTDTQTFTSNTPSYFWTTCARNIEKSSGKIVCGNYLSDLKEQKYACGVATGTHSEEIFQLIKKFNTLSSYRNDVNTAFTAKDDSGFRKAQSRKSLLRDINKINEEIQFLPDDMKSISRWPGNLSLTVRTILDISAGVVKNWNNSLSDNETDSFSTSDSGVNTAKKDNPTRNNPLLSRAQYLVHLAQDTSLAPAIGINTTSVLESDLSYRAQQALQKQSISTTRLVKAGMANNSQEYRAILKQIIRPMPQAPSLAAHQGTEFHQWAQETLEILQKVDTNEQREMVISQLRDFLDKEIDNKTEKKKGNSEKNPQKEWKKRLLCSQWVHAPVDSIEIEYNIEIFNHRVPAKLDAVFHRGLDGDEKRLTIIDWKTGRIPRSKEERESKLLQIDLYRLALSRAREIPLHMIDGGLFYVSEPKEERAFLTVQSSNNEQELIERIEKYSALWSLLREERKEDS